MESVPHSVLSLEGRGRSRYRAFTGVQSSLLNIPFAFHQKHKETPFEAAAKRSAKTQEGHRHLEKKGASEARLIKVSDVVVDERVRLKCQVPICDSTARTSCAAYLPSVGSSEPRLPVMTGDACAVERPPSQKSKGEQGRLRPARVLHELVNLGERLCFEAGWRFATGSSGAAAALRDLQCDGTEGHCATLRARPSMEAMASTSSVRWRRRTCRNSLPVNGERDVDGVDPAVAGSTVF